MSDYLAILRSSVAQCTGCELSELSEERVQAEGVNSHTSLNSQPSTNTNGERPPVDRPIRYDHAAWLLTLDEAENRAWWRSAARLVCENGGDWAAAENLATEKMKVL